MSNYYDENELIRRIQKGDESALAIIISEYHAYVGKIVYSILGSYSHKIDLQGVVNQIFFTLWHKANKIDPLKSVTIKGYLGTLARNTAINEKKKCIPDYQINDEVIADISDDFNQVELRLLLANALRKLNKDEQLILVLFYFQNEKIADISRITGIPASTVKSKLLYYPIKRSILKITKLQALQHFVTRYRPVRYSLSYKNNQCFIFNTGR